MSKKFAPQLNGLSGQMIRTGNMEMYCERYGSGAPLLLLHGFGGCCQNWHAFVEKLGEKHHLILVDLRGHGHSTNPGKQFTHQQAADDVFLLLEQLGIKRFSAMGMSTGAMVLLHMATAQPERIVSMVLISATSHFPEQAKVIMRQSSFDTMPAEVRDMYSECAKRGEGQIRELIGLFNNFAENDKDMNFTALRLSGITARTLLIHGERDKFFPVEIALDLERSIPGSVLWVIPGGEHVPVFDLRVPFVQKALEFLDIQDGTF